MPLARVGTFRARGLEKQIDDSGADLLAALLQLRDNLVRPASAIPDAGRPGDDHRVARAAEVAGHLLGPLERRIHRVRPGGREVVVVLRAAELVDNLQIVKDWRFFCAGRLGG